MPSLIARGKERLVVGHSVPRQNPYSLLSISVGSGFVLNIVRQGKQERGEGFCQNLVAGPLIHRHLGLVDSNATGPLIHRCLKLVDNNITGENPFFHLLHQERRSNLEDWSVHYRARQSDPDLRESEYFGLSPWVTHRRKRNDRVMHDWFREPIYRSGFHIVNLEFNVYIRIHMQEKKRGEGRTIS